MNSNAQFPQADNLEFLYQIFTSFDDAGLNRYSFSERYKLADRQGAYYLNALCFIGVAEKKGKNTFLNDFGKQILAFEEPFRRKVFILAIFENQFICETYQRCKGLERMKQQELIQVLIAGAYGISEEATKKRRARTLASWFRWIDSQDYYIEEKYNA